jgi:hypothetical protein
MTGYLPQPFQITGTFVLVRPFPIAQGLPCCQDTVAPKGELTLPEIRAGGKDASAVEFEDIDCAMQYYRDPQSGLTVSKTTMKDAIAEYDQNLKNLNK